MRHPYQSIALRSELMSLNKRSQVKKKKTNHPAMQASHRRAKTAKSAEATRNKVGRFGVARQISISTSQMNKTTTATARNTNRAVMSSGSSAIFFRFR